MAILSPEVLNSDWAAYSEFNNYRATVYTLVFKGELSNEIMNLSNNYKEISNLSNEMISQNQKSQDFENGDSKTYANDLRRSADLMKQYNNMAVLKVNLQNVVNELVIK